jgi:hypothetical protein
MLLANTLPDQGSLHKAEKASLVLDCGEGCSLVAGGDNATSYLTLRSLASLTRSLLLS